MSRTIVERAARSLLDSITGGCKYGHELIYYTGKQGCPICNASPWRSDMENAPKDKAILGFANGEQTTVKWFSYANDTEGFWSLVEAGAFAEDGEWTPTHWAPLPAAPKEKG